MNFLVSAPAADELRYIEEGLGDDDRDVRTSALIVLMERVHSGFRPEPQLVERLKHKVETVHYYHERGFAWFSLVHLHPPGFDDWIMQFTQIESDWDIKRNAMLHLLEHGDKKQLHGLLEGTALWGEPQELAGALWAYREDASLSAAERAAIYRAAEADMRESRERHDHWVSPPKGWRRYKNSGALTLALWMARGLRYEAEDVGRVETFVEAPWPVYRGDRARAVGGLGHVPGATVEAALRRMESSRFATVRRAATRALEGPRLEIEH